MKTVVVVQLDLRVCGGHDGGLIVTNRLNTKLESKDLEPMTDLVKDFSNGVKLIEVRGDYFTSLRRCARHESFVLTGRIAVGACDLRAGIGWEWPEPRLKVCSGDHVGPESGAI